MTETKTRRIFKSAYSKQSEVKDLLQALLIAEIMSPSRCLWVVSPWLSDIEILDNRAGAFTALDIAWGKRHIRFAELLGKILTLGSTLVVATRPNIYSNRFVERLQEFAQDTGSFNNLIIRKSEVLHIKGLLGANFYVSGSMNFTFNGIEILEEGVTYDVDSMAIAEARIAFYHSYGGSL